MTYAQLGTADVKCVDKPTAQGLDQIAHACDLLACSKLERRVFALDNSGFFVLG